MKYQPLTKETIDMLKSLDDSSYVSPEQKQEQETEITPAPEQKHKPTPLPKPVKGTRQKVCRSSQGQWREINPDLLLELAKSRFSASELRVIIYSLWSISSDKSRNYIKVKRKTIQERTKLSQSQVHKVIHSLIDKKVLVRTEDDDTYIFNATVSTWHK